MCVIYITNLYKVHILLNSEKHQQYKLQKLQHHSYPLRDYHEKHIISYRLGLSYVKEFFWYNGRFYKGFYFCDRLKNTTAKQNRCFTRYENQLDFKNYHT